MHSNKDIQCEKKNLMCKHINHQNVINLSDKCKLVFALAKLLFCGENFPAKCEVQEINLTTKETNLDIFQHLYCGK